MSKAVKKLSPLDPFTHAVVTGETKALIDPTVQSKQEAKKKAAKEAAILAGAPSVEKLMRVQTEQFGERREDLRAQAGAAGATRIENDYDLLGRPKRAKAKGASRVLLGE